MNPYQSLWWEQTRSDHSVLLLLRQKGAGPCHQLHYLQMVTGKLGKAYFWRTGHPPRRSHASFVRFLQALDDRPGPDRTRIAKVLGFGRAQDFENWMPTITPLAYDLERLAPDLAGESGPNPEYPWPWAAPDCAPASYEFGVWKQLIESGRGRQLLKVIDAAVLGFPKLNSRGHIGVRCCAGSSGLLLETVAYSEDSLFLFVICHSSFVIRCFEMPRAGLSGLLTGSCSA